jgi:hypothetical protein
LRPPRETAPSISTVESAIPASGHSQETWIVPGSGNGAAATAVDEDRPFPIVVSEGAPATDI